MTLYSLDDTATDGTLTFTPVVHTAEAPAPDPTPAPPSVPISPPSETPSEPSETLSETSGAETTSTAPDGTQYSGGQIDPQPEDAPAPVPPAADAPAQYQDGKIDDPNDLPALTQEQRDTQYPEPPAPPSTEGL